jgi:DNA-binding response OmpR family regulator
MILVVEDDSSLRDAICVNLEAEGLSTVGVADGLAARAFLEDAPLGARPLELLVCDHDALRQDGGALLTWLRRQREPLASTPVVIVSGEDPREADKTRAAFGARACLAKPFDLDQLLALAGKNA